MTECMSSPAQRPSRVALDALGFAFRSASACLGFGLLFWNEVRVCGRVLLPARPSYFDLETELLALRASGDALRASGAASTAREAAGAMETQALRADLAAATERIHVLTGAIDEMKTEFRLYKLQPGNFAYRLQQLYLVFGKPTVPQRTRPSARRVRARGGEGGGRLRRRGRG